MSWYERQESWRPQNEDARDDGDIDYGRVIHSASFRRLQGKTQILNLGDSDFYRTRLTHSLEVAQIAGSIVSQLAKLFPDHEAVKHLPSRSLIQAIGCAHDLGHPPFGHGGEVALNYCMRDNGGFEGNGQSLRILARLENFSATAGANLSRRSLLGVLKYPVPYSKAINPDLFPKLADGPTAIKVLDVKSCKPPKCYLDSEQDVVEWILSRFQASDREIFQKIIQKIGCHSKSQHKSFDCSVMDVADDIAYGVHDLEDAIAMGLVSKDAFSAALHDRCPSFLDALKAKYPLESGNDVFLKFVEGLFGDGRSRKHSISRLVHHFVTAVKIIDLDEFYDPVARFRVNLHESQREFLDALQGLVVSEVIKTPAVQHLEFKGQEMVVSVFEALHADPDRLLPKDALARYRRANADSRLICDYVAGMTDTYLLRTYERLFSPRMGSVFDKL
ncbi:anti-phage deoxyguanosine triphosphatase [Xanthobacteraceae bacterium A53D]